MIPQENFKQQPFNKPEITQETVSNSNGSVFRFNSKDLEEAFEDGKQDAKPKWIPCSEKLPEVFCCYISNYVLTINKFLYYAVEYYDYREGMFASEKTYGKGSVLYWMPLHEPPQEGGEE